MAWLRKIFNKKISQNPQTGKIDHLDQTGEYHKLKEEDGCLVSYHLDNKANHHCGCFGLEGGRCAEPGCGVISCVRCHRHCGGTENPHPSSCGAPLCREHAHYLQMAEGQAAIPFCKNCYGKLVRMQRWKAVGQLLLQPFIETNEDGNERR